MPDSKSHCSQFANLLQNPTSSYRCSLKEATPFTIGRYLIEANQLFIMPKSTTTKDWQMAIAMEQTQAITTITTIIITASATIMVLMVMDQVIIVESIC